jgi:hypothetical protein
MTFIAELLMVKELYAPIKQNNTLPVPVAASSKAWVCGCSLSRLSVVSVVCCRVEVSVTS